MERREGPGQAEPSTTRSLLLTQGKESRVLIVDEGCELCNLRLVKKSLCLYLVF